MRDWTRVVIAENDTVLAEDIRAYFIEHGSMQAWTVAAMRDIIPQLEASNAAWLILDIELDDGHADEMIPQLREKYQRDLIIVVLTGKSRQYSEFHTLEVGADFSLRKPMEPRALLMMMKRSRENSLSYGNRLCSLRLQYKERCIDLAERTVATVAEVVDLSRQQADLLALLAVARDENGRWVEVPSKTIWSALYGHDAEEEPEKCAARLRKLCAGLDDLLGEGAIDRSGRAAGRQSVYVLHSDVQLLPADADER